LRSLFRIGAYDEVTHYGKIVVPFKQTIHLMADMDEVGPSWPIQQGGAWVWTQVDTKAFV
jgi:hypothetical protein